MTYPSHRADGADRAHRALPYAGYVALSGLGWVPHRGGPHRVVPHRVVPHRVVPHRVVLHRVVPHRAVPHRVVSHRAVPYVGYVALLGLGWESCLF